MIDHVYANNFKCLRQVDASLRPFQILVGPNGSGKSTFLSVVSLLGNVVADGPQEAYRQISDNFPDLLWQKRDSSLEIAAQFPIPDRFRRQREEAGSQDFSHVRYTVNIGTIEAKGVVGLLKEQVHLVNPNLPFLSRGAARTIVNKIHGKKDSFSNEFGGKWNPYFKLGPLKSALGNLPEDEDIFPVAVWLKGVLRTSVVSVALSPRLLREPSSPDRAMAHLTDGGNLGLLVESLKKNRTRFARWVKHVQTALPDLADISVVDRPEDRKRYLRLQYTGGELVPSWCASEGTMRLLALTLLAYIDHKHETYLIEEPENGIHPLAVETVYQSLSSIYDAQVLVATHSPVFLRTAKIEEILCFEKREETGTRIVAGENHPALSEWRTEEALDLLFAGGVLG